MKSETQRKILDAVSRVFSEVAKALDNNSLGYEEGIRFIRINGDKTIFELLLEIVKNNALLIGQEQTLTPDNIHGLLDAMSTCDKAAAVLLEFPEPNPEKLETILREVSLFLSSIRRVLLPVAKKLPPPPGGAPRSILKADEPKIREKIAQLFNDGYSLPNAKAKVARDEGVSLSTIQRICRKGTIQIEVYESDQERIE